jgi:dihydrofolate synthase/folylpolyglutamate synthase
MTYKETLDWMFAQLPMYQHLGTSALNARLDNIRAFAEHLGQPEKQFRSVHVGGTNGKGSSSHMLASVLQEAGYKTGLYTSPHLKDFRERMRINGSPISEEAVLNFIGEHRSFLQKHRLSFFEMSVGMAFDFFAREGVDVAVIEVGLGGRLDATNIIVPEVSLITNIGLDHTEILGDSHSKITREKAGIIKPGVPVVISETQAEVAAIFREIAGERNAPITFADQTVKKIYPTSLLGDYQHRNVRGVLATLKKLKGFRVEESHIKAGLLKVVENTGLQGRWQIVRELPRVILDTAHNREGLALTVRQVNKQAQGRIHFVLGFVKGKNLDLILPLFPKHASYYFSRANIPRGLDAELLQAAARKHGLEGAVYDTVPEALVAALGEASETDVIYVGGSTFTVADAL